ncbi:YjjG family noncanonical pyrimidine nucleotidase [Enterococcus gallinarum]|uniref:TIGR02254 family HAD hydrolase n=1 Tax=Enterococcus gallinarum TaxID=1353 RepID=A0A376H191_ENTGA|nr:YjjG family noncanonical pyrimidine nucleotidase [Enterococcus gallinarum]OJG50817.1 HAD family hydrolase [Enterococcus gallinarum]STD84063.1 TIGR02254 family HAD hydrolase [Enterococcus gallinarum]STD85611.1 TIGR02254 family HAD hydrolase [Enterococcus gallinarum]
MTYKTLLFDVDDTILDFQDTEHEALMALFAEQGLTMDLEMKQTYQEVNHRLWQQFEQGKLSRDQVVNERFGLFFKKYGRIVDSEAMEKHYRSYLDQGHKLLGNSQLVLAELADKFDLYVVTNGVSKTQYRRLSDAKLMPYFQDIFVSEDTGYQKPMKEFFTYVFDRIPNFEQQKTVIIGDSLSSDILGGHLSGIDTIWLNPNKKVASTVLPTYEIQSLDQLPSLLKS